MFKAPPIRRKIKLYSRYTFVDYVYINTVQKLYAKFKKSAKDEAERISWDRVVLYAMFDYNPKSQAIESAYFLNVVLKYEDYAEFVGKMTNSKRFFFVRGRKEYKYE